MTVGPRVRHTRKMFPVSVDEYRVELQQAADSLRGETDRVGIRGKGTASFLFAESDKGALELSRVEDHSWLEFWGPESDQPFESKTYGILEAAIHVAIGFLRTGSAMDE